MKVTDRMLSCWGGGGPSHWKISDNKTQYILSLGLEETLALLHVIVVGVWIQLLELIPLLFIHFSWLGLWFSSISFSSAPAPTQYPWLQMIQTGWNEPFTQTCLWVVVVFFTASVLITPCPVWIQVSSSRIIRFWTLICNNLHLSRSIASHQAYHTSLSN